MSLRAFPASQPSASAVPRRVPSQPAVEVAIGVVVLSVAVRSALQSELGPGVPFLQFFPAIMVAAWYGVWYAGLLATTLSAAADVCSFLTMPGKPASTPTSSSPSLPTSCTALRLPSPRRALIPLIDTP